MLVIDGIESAALEIDGNPGFAPLGPDIQAGEEEFVTAEWQSLRRTRGSADRGRNDRRQNEHNHAALTARRGPKSTGARMSFAATKAKSSIPLLRGFMVQLLRDNAHRIPYDKAA